MKKHLNPTLLADFYKISHRTMYPEGTEYVYSTFTPRASKISGIENVVAFGLQAFTKEFLIEFFNDNFFSQPKETVIAEYARIVKNTLGVPNPETKHLEDLHDLGYLPLKITALPEGTIVPLRTPVLTIENTNPKFFWLTNYVESMMSAELWQVSTSATIALQYRKLLDRYATETGGDLNMVQFQGHDFSMRGMEGVAAGARSGLGHLLSFVGTDTIPSIQEAEKFYNANVEKELVGCSIPATEHSVQCVYGNDDLYIKDMITKVHPNGLVSIVSDGYDYWDVIGRVLPSLKTEIMSRSGGPVGDKVVIRPDSGDPVKIVCGDPNGATELERKGSIEALWDIFGGTVNDLGYKVLDPHIGLIYGDSITLARAEEILSQLKAKKFASTNVVFGIGSYTYQYNTRDTFGYAMKATSATVNGDERQIFKSPKTDDGTKISQKGRVCVFRSEYTDKKVLWIDGLSKKEMIGVEQDKDELLRTTFENGKLLIDENFADIRARLKNN